MSAVGSVSGKVLDIEILSNYCRLCEKEDNDEHECHLNHSGSSNAMEPAGAVRIFSRSIETRGLKYTDYLGDGDTSAYRAVCQSKPYGEDGVIAKRECIGHIQKRVGSRMRKLKASMKGKILSDGKTIGGAGRLTDKVIDRCQNYYGMAIRANTNSIVDMQTNIMSSLYHVASSSDRPNHDLCPAGPESWCGWQRNPDSYIHKAGLPECIVNLLEPIYDDLSSTELLSKCLHGQTQNSNESCCVGSSDQRAMGKPKGSGTGCLFSSWTVQ